MLNATLPRPPLSNTIVADDSAYVNSVTSDICHSIINNKKANACPIWPCAPPDGQLQLGTHRSHAYAYMKI